MPYIPQEDRRSACSSSKHTKAGDLNYLVTRAVDDFLGAHGVSYDSLNAAIGVLECAKLELYRRIAAPYEDVKLAENGDVYTVAEN